jgi:hypothetical protein
MKTTRDPTQSQVMNSDATSGLISDMTTMASPGRMSNTLPGSNNAETSPY